MKEHGSNQEVSDAQVKYLQKLREASVRDALEGNYSSINTAERSVREKQAQEKPKLSDTFNVVT